MRKQDELNKASSCLNRSSDHEMLFVLRGNDVCAPIAIRTWIEARVLMRKNTLSDPQIQEAQTCAQIMEIEREQREKT